MQHPPKGTCEKRLHSTPLKCEQHVDGAPLAPLSQSAHSGLEAVPVGPTLLACPPPPLRSSGPTRTLALEPRYGEGARVVFSGNADDNERNEGRRLLVLRRAVAHLSSYTWSELRYFETPFRSQKRWAGRLSKRPQPE